MKTIEQHFNDLPDGYRERALRNMDEVNKSSKVPSVARALTFSFDWRDTDEGCDFWRDVAMFYDGLKNQLPPLPKESLTFEKVTNENWAWLVEMGWTDKTTTLEDIALIASEIGEAANECRGEKIGDGLKYELADIILRTLGTARKAGIDIEAAIVEKMRKNRERGNGGRLK